MFIQVRHTTRYTYGADVRYSIQSLRLTPPSFEGQRIIDWSIVAPGIEKAVRFHDAFGNVAHLVALLAVHDETLIVAEGVVETENTSGVVKGLAEIAPLRIFLRETERTKADAAIIDLGDGIQGTDPLERLHVLMNRVRDKVDYVIGATEGHTSAAEALSEGRGVCQDHAQIFISAARSMDVPARYVNGYLLGAGDGRSEAHHAWAEAWVEALGWVGFDPANRICPTEHYVRLACGLDASSAAPIRGTRRGGASEALDVVVEVQQQSAQQ